MLAFSCFNLVGTLQSAVDAGYLTVEELGAEEIAQMQKQEVSIMPGNFSDMLTTKEFYGVILFLLSQK